jgi:lysophospholipase L1-like esterase
MMRRWAAALLVAASVTACGPDDPAPAGGASYVAMGDSYVSGPGIAPQERGSGACLRSDADYPTLLADALDIRTFADVSCGGATTDHLVDSFTSTTGDVKAQLDAVSPATELVTVGIGGNDGNLYEGLFNSCVFPTIRSASGCRFFATSQAPEILAATRPKIVHALERITRKAPQAEVRLVGYLRILPDSGTCPALGLGRGYVTHGSSVLRQIDATQRAAAREAGVEYVSLRAMSQGHDVCAGSEAWVNGLGNTPTDGIYLHPRSAGMRAVAAFLAAPDTTRG